jgi:hypothetical protein
MLRAHYLEIESGPHFKAFLLQLRQVSLTHLSKCAMRTAFYCCEIETERLYSRRQIWLWSDIAVSEVESESALHLLSHQSPMKLPLHQVTRTQAFQRLAFPPRLLSVTRNNHCMLKLAAILANSIAIMTHMLPKYTGRL